MVSAGGERGGWGIPLRSGGACGLARACRPLGLPPARGPGHPGLLRGGARAACGPDPRGLRVLGAAFAPGAAVVTNLKEP